MIWMFAIFGSLLMSTLRFMTTNHTLYEEAAIFGISVVLILVVFLVVQLAKLAIGE